MIFGIRAILGFALIVAALGTSVFAQAQPAIQQQTLQKYVADLQNNPNDAALRGKIIALAQTMKTPPAVPADAYELVGRASYAIKNASTDADFMAAADAYGKALQLAPWIADYYFNQGVAYEKAKHFDEAIADFNWYLTAAPNANDANEVRERIGGLKYAKEKAEDEQRAAAARATYEASPEGRAEKERNDFAELLRKIDGRTYTYTDTAVNRPDYVLSYWRIVIEGNYLAPASKCTAHYARCNFQWTQDERIAIQGRVTTITVWENEPDTAAPGVTMHRVDTYIISGDGESIVKTSDLTTSDGFHSNNSVTFIWQH